MFFCLPVCSAQPSPFSEGREPRRGCDACRFGGKQFFSVSGIFREPVKYGTFRISAYTVQTFSYFVGPQGRHIVSIEMLSPIYKPCIRSRMPWVVGVVVVASRVTLAVKWICGDGREGGRRRRRRSREMGRFVVCLARSHAIWHWQPIGAPRHAAAADLIGNPP